MGELIQRPYYGEIIPPGHKLTRWQKRAARAQARLNEHMAHQLTKRETLETVRLYHAFEQAKLAVKRERAQIKLSMKRDKIETRKVEVLARETMRQAKLETRIKYAEARQSGMYVGFWNTSGRLLARAARLRFPLPRFIRPRVYPEARRPPEQPSNENFTPPPETYRPMNTENTYGFEKTKAGLYVPNNKFSLTEQVKFELGRHLHRVEAVANFGDVRKGTLGGWVESAKNLSQYGAAWIGEEGMALGDAVVDNDAQLFGVARIRDNVHLTDFAQVFGNADLSGNVRVGGRAKIGGTTQLGGNEYIGGDIHLIGTPRPHFGTPQAG